LFKFHFL